MNRTLDNLDLNSKTSYTNWTPITLRFGDMDSLGHINNVSVASYIEVARTTLIHGVMDKFGYRNLNFVLANLAINYHKEFYYPGTIDVGARLSSLGNKSVKSVYGIFLGNDCVATGESTNVFFDTESRRSVAPPDDLREALTMAIHQP